SASTSRRATETTASRSGSTSWTRQTKTLGGFTSLPRATRGGGRDAPPEHGGRGDVKHLLGIDDLGADGIGEVLRLADSFLEVTRRDIPKVPALRGKTVVSMFYEDSTRTPLS